MHFFASLNQKLYNAGGCGWLVLAMAQQENTGRSYEWVPVNSPQQQTWQRYARTKKIKKIDAKCV